MRTMLRFSTPLLIIIIIHNVVDKNATVVIIIALGRQVWPMKGSYFVCRDCWWGMKWRRLSSMTC